MFNSHNAHPSFNDDIWSTYPNQVDLRKPFSLLKVAHAENHLKLNNYQTFCLVDISREVCIENAIVFDFQRGILKTTQTTRELMRQCYRQVDYLHSHALKQLALANDVTPIKLPFISGTVCLLPMTSAIQQSSSWFSSTQLTDCNVVSDRCTELTYFDKIRLIIPLSVTRVRRQLRDSRKLQQVIAISVSLQEQNPADNWFLTNDGKLLWYYEREAILIYTKHILEINGFPATAQDIHAIADNYFGKF
ncbi:hypothetical protein ACFQH1_09485 [Lactiplantibacillus daoliensis]|uniref:Uncharacterized protein n=1 Tax=Lactiplantibacillus daoliensis TaxID=2559916 RepID=A0ABW1UHV7_9LACO|nr:hypothetical protein [Lactiplantibacillus daoliensis]